MADDTDVTQDEALGIEGQTGDPLPEGVVVPDDLTEAVKVVYVPLEQPRTEHRPPVSEPVQYQPYE